MVYVSGEVLHPFASVTTMLYAPGANALISWVIALKPFGPVHAYAYPAAPPLTVISILASAAPFQLIPNPLKSEMISLEISNKLKGCATIMLLINLLIPFASATFTV